MDRSLQQLYTSMPRNSLAGRIRPQATTSRPASPLIKKAGLSQGYVLIFQMCLIKVLILDLS